MTNTPNFKMPSQADVLALDALAEALAAVRISDRLVPVARSVQRQLGESLELLIGGRNARDVLNLLLARPDLGLIDALALVREESR